MHKFDSLLRLLAAGTLAFSASALAADEWWLFELTSHFRAHYVAAQAILVMLLMLRARWGWCFVLLPAMALNVIPLAPYWPRPTSDNPLLGVPLTLMSANLNHENTEYVAFIDLLQAEPPDIVLLVEFNSGWSEATQRLHGIYPHRIEIPRDDAFGIALYSRRPFLDQRSLQVQTTSAIDVRVNLAGGTARLLGVHLRSPVNAERAAERNQQLSQLTAIARQEAGPLLVLGDFNISPYSPIFASTLGTSGLHDSGLARGWHFSWPTYLHVPGVPIDLFLLSEHFVALDHRRGPAFGSDHYPMIATVALR